MIAEQIASIEAAEDLFALLGEVYQPSILRVHRLHILKRFGEAISRVERFGPPPKTEGERRTAYAKALREAHDAFTDGNAAVEPFVRRRISGLVNIRRSTATNTG